MREGKNKTKNEHWMPYFYEKILSCSEINRDYWALQHIFHARTLRFGGRGHLGLVW